MSLISSRIIGESDVDRLIKAGLPKADLKRRITFREEQRGYHSGQHDMTLHAELDGQAVGYVEYSVLNDEVSVQYIKTLPGHERMGVATALMKHLQSEYPEQEIDLGMSTDSGTPFVASLNREFKSSADYDLYKAQYDQAVAERDALQAEFDAWEGRITPNMEKKAERLNQLHDLTWELEQQLRNLKSGRWLIREDEEPPPPSGLIQAMKNIAMQQVSGLTGRGWVKSFQIFDHGIDNSQYFQGCSSGGYDAVFTGAGNSAHEALDDALDSAASAGWEVQKIENRFDPNSENTVYRLLSPPEGEE